MIVCTKCGQGNDDAARYCRRCTHKLQSERFEPAADLPDIGGLPPPDPEMLRGHRELVQKSAEAWTWAVLAAASALIGAAWELWWLPVAVVPLAGLAAWQRRL
jgi:uncharacterized membrane protein YvbJ